MATTTVNVSTEYERLAKLANVPLDRFPLDKATILRAVRRVWEVEHRRRLWEFSGSTHWLDRPFHQPVNFESLSGLRLEDADASCDCTAPIFILRNSSVKRNPIPPYHGADTPHHEMAVLLIHLHNYIYKRWFRPYKSEIDRDEFLTKVHLPFMSLLPHETCSVEMVDWVRKLSGNLVARINATKADAVKIGKSTREEMEAGRALYHLRPVFKAVAISLRSADFDYEHPDVANLPVLIVRTGIEEGLKAPITFETVPMEERINSCRDEEGTIIAIETRLERAITFLLELEQCEFVDMTHTAFIPREWSSLAEALGWDPATMGPITGPSSSWADPMTFSSWPEHDRLCDDRYIREAEMKCRNAKTSWESLKKRSVERGLYVTDAFEKQN